MYSPSSICELTPDLNFEHRPYNGQYENFLMLVQYRKIRSGNHGGFVALSGEAYDAQAIGPIRKLRIRLIFKLGGFIV